MSNDSRVDELDHEPIPVLQDRGGVYFAVGGVKWALTADAAEMTGLRLIEAAMTARQWLYPGLGRASDSPD